MNSSFRTEHENLHFKHFIIAYASEHVLVRRMPINILQITHQFHVSPRLRCRTYTDDCGVVVKYIEGFDR